MFQGRFCQSVRREMKEKKIFRTTSFHRFSRQDFAEVSWQMLQLADGMAFLCSFYFVCHVFKNRS
jgi:hypothetical protein